MTDPHAVIAGLCTDFAEMSQRMARVSGQLAELDRVLQASSPQQPGQPAGTPAPRADTVGAQQVPSGFGQPPYAVPAGYPAPGYAPPSRYPHPGYAPPQYPPPGYPRLPHDAPPGPARQPRYSTSPAPAGPHGGLPSPAQRRDRRLEDGWIGKLLAVAGVTVTLIGVVLLVVLAAQAGLLRPQIRVGAGAALAAALIMAGTVVRRRAGGRLAAIALAATGVAAGYIDVIAVTAIYGWVSELAGLAVAAAIAGAGLLLARRWDSEQLGLLVVIPLVVLTPVVTQGITLLLVAFMIALSAAALPIEIGKDWVWIHAARSTAATLPLLVALLDAALSPGASTWPFVLACGAVAVLAIAGALAALPSSSAPVGIVLLSALGVVPVLLASMAISDPVAAALAAVLSAGLLAVVAAGRRLPGVSATVSRTWGALAAVAALVAVVVAFDGYVAGPVLLGMAAVVALAGRRHRVALCSAVGFWVVGALFFLGYAPPRVLVDGVVMPTAAAVSALFASVLLAAAAVVIAWSSAAGGVDLGWPRAIWAAAGLVVLYAVTTFTVTAGVLIGGAGGGFLAGHTVATICWIALAAAMFGCAARPDAAAVRPAMIAGGLALTVAALVKLFVFDLATLGGMFRVSVFIVVGLVVLGMGVAYARILAQQEQAAEADEMQAEREPVAG